MGFLRNEKGQMAIFVALFFQVIFVFFAMSINVGMVIHDKINLQNAVDLAAYYGAMKQAEVLNQIAHINFQMRQNYKLFVWRYRVLGVMGHKDHPLYIQNYWSRNRKTLYDESKTWAVTGGNSFEGMLPAVCVAHSTWTETQQLDDSSGNLCSSSNFKLPAMDDIPNPTGFVPGSGDIPNIADYLRNQLATFCLEAGLANWMYAARMLMAFRVDGYVRKKMIKKLADGLSSENPLDLRGEPIQQGVETTFRKNLTDTNRSGIQQFSYLNSLSQGQCANREFWLPEVMINPTILYMDWNSNQETGECPPAENKVNRPSTIPSEPYAFNYTLFNDRKNATATLQSHWASEPGNDSFHSSHGFEKNPWCMLYSGVSATTVVRKPFSPGGGITLRARGFAKPFGGRVGPWYGRNWPRGNQASISTNRDLMVDRHLPSRYLPGVAASSGDKFQDMANHSRFPGDPLGMDSYRALSAMIQPLMNALGQRQTTDPAPLALANYNTLNGVDLLLSTGDPLARRGATKDGTVVEARQRNFELAATLPDAFDALYYSIEPTYFENYFLQQTTNNGAQLPENSIIYDFGSTKDGEYDSNKQYGVQNQIQGHTNKYMPDYEPVVRKWQQLLTSWHQKGAVDYELDPERFAKCSSAIKNKEYPMPGNCITGGRTGYSVKNISMDYLLSSEHAVGGDDTTGNILNPPPNEF